ncbi:MAG: putative N-acetylmannosamine-6-phosphate 2-epimerase [Methanoregulaceae archaeon]|nr:putative N-acetylmannosamine-6-phosphate 2-epimerase [Methanoregulaceae archaeon]
MTIADLLVKLRRTPLVVSVQASPESPLASTGAIVGLARASQTALGLPNPLFRLEGIDQIEAVRAATDCESIGLIKREYDDSEVYITPTLAEVRALIETECEVIALDATKRPRPAGCSLRELVAEIHGAGGLAMGDLDDIASLPGAIEAGCDLIGTTLAGYTKARVKTCGPDLELLREFIKLSPVPVIAEGRYSTPAQAQLALRIGAAAVVIGGAINDPVKQTLAFANEMGSTVARVGAVDIGGTWLRFGLFEDGRLIESERIALPGRRDAREDWIRERVEFHRVERLGISTGGTVDPATGVVWEAKPIIPEHEGCRLSSSEFGVPTLALNDGLATAWGHACHPDFAGRRVATLALGTGVGVGFVAGHRLEMGAGGAYPRLNDLSPVAGSSFEDLLGGAALSPEPSDDQMDRARLAAARAVRVLHALWMPDVIVLSGGVGLQPWLGLDELPSVVRSPYGADAGLWGAAWLAWSGPSV